MLDRPVRKSIRLPAAAYRVPGTAWLVTIGVNDRSAKPFSDSIIAEAVVGTLVARLKSLKLGLDAYCLMPDHLHLVIQLTVGDLVTAIGDVKSNTTRTWWKHGGNGSLWQRSFHDRGLRNEKDHSAAVQYVIENPVRAGFVAAWEQYPFSGGDFAKETVP